MKVTDEMVSRFLCWRLPDDFGPDCGITFAKFHPNGATRYEPVGTNLLTAPQARQMLEHVIEGAQLPEPSPTGRSAAVGGSVSEQDAQASTGSGVEGEQADTPRIDPMQDPMRPGYFMNYAEGETPAEMVLRKLACWLGVGGYNAPKVDADVFHRKIVDGVQMLLATSDKGRGEQADSAALLRDIALIARDYEQDIAARMDEIERLTAHLTAWAAPSPESAKVYTAPPEPARQVEERLRFLKDHAEWDNEGGKGYWRIQFKSDECASLFAAIDDALTNKGQGEQK